MNLNRNVPAGRFYDYPGHHYCSCVIANEDEDGSPNTWTASSAAGKTDGQ